MILYTTKPSQFSGRYSISESNGLYYNEDLKANNIYVNEGLTSLPLTEANNIYVIYDFTSSQKARMLYAQITIAGVAVINNLNLVPVANERAYSRIYCLIADQLKNDIISNWWKTGTTTLGDCEVSKIDYPGEGIKANPVQINASDQIISDSNPGDSQNIGVILHPEETSNEYYMCAGLTDSDQYIYAAIDADYSNVNVEVEQIS